MDLRYMFDANGNQNVPHREWIMDFKQAISEVRAMLEEQGRGEEFIGAKVGKYTVTECVRHG
jgi:adenosine deaminase CECR1